MRILKNIDHELAGLIGEMINIEESTLLYVDGKKVDPVPGYPVVKDSGRQDTVRSALGYIYLPEGYDREVFVTLLENKLKDFEDGIPVTPSHHTIMMGHCTNVRIIPFQQSTKAVKNNHPHGNYRNKLTAIRRVILIGSSSTHGAMNRFTWLIDHISNFPFEIAAVDLHNAMSKYCASIFFDSDNICTLNHNDITLSFRREHLRGHTQLTGQTIRLCRFGNPLLAELYSTPIYYVRPLIKRPRQGNYNELTFAQTPLNDGSGKSSADVCVKCRKPVWGDNYALAGHIDNPYDTRCVIVCPICMHEATCDPIEKSYFHLLRISCPRTIEDMIMNPSYSSIKRELMRELLKGVVTKSTPLHNSSARYHLIGDKFVAFDNERDYLFTKLCSEFNDRRVCKLDS